MAAEDEGPGDGGWDEVVEPERPDEGAVGVGVRGNRREKGCDAHGWEREVGIVLSADGSGVEDEEGSGCYDEAASDVGEAGDGGVRLAGVVSGDGDVPVAEAEGEEEDEDPREAAEEGGWIWFFPGSELWGV